MSINTNKPRNPEEERRTVRNPQTGRKQTSIGLFVLLHVHLTNTINMNTITIERVNVVGKLKHGIFLLTNLHYVKYRKFVP